MCYKQVYWEVYWTVECGRMESPKGKETYGCYKNLQKVTFFDIILEV